MNRERLGALAAELRRLPWIEDEEWKTGDPGWTTRLQGGMRLERVTDFDAGTVHQTLTRGDGVQTSRTAGDIAGVAGGIFADEIDDRLQTGRIRLHGGDAARIRQAVAAVLDLDTEQAGTLFRMPAPKNETAAPGPGLAARAAERTRNGERGRTVWRATGPGETHSARAPRAICQQDRITVRTKLNKDTLPRTSVVFDLCERIAAVPGIVWTANDHGGIRGAVPGASQLRPVYLPDPEGRDGGRWHRRPDGACICPVAALSWEAEEDKEAAADITQSPWDTIDEMAPALIQPWRSAREDIGYKQLIRALHLLVAGCDRAQVEGRKALTLGPQPLEARERMSESQWLSAADRTAEAMYAYTAWLLTGRDPAGNIPAEAKR